MKHYILIKREGPDARGRMLSAAQSADQLLSAGVWPLWEHTRNRKAIAAGDHLAIYLAGASQVVATAAVAAVSSWNATLRNSYPLQLDGTPVAVLRLADVQRLVVPVDVKARLARLSFVPPGSRKWGVAFMGGSRAVGAADFAAMTE